MRGSLEASIDLNWVFGECFRNRGLEAEGGVMRKLEMTVERNPYPEPGWLQVVGILRKPAFSD